MSDGIGNGSTAANPFTQKPEYQYQEPGLTKREHLASLAPDNIPSWFVQSCDEIHNNPKFTWYREGNDFQIGECGLTQEGEQVLYFAWRTFYADALLKELSK